MLHLAQPIPADDDLLMSDDERTAFLTPIPRPELDAFRMVIGDSPFDVRYASDVRLAARRFRDERLRAAAQAREAAA